MRGRMWSDALVCSVLSCIVQALLNLCKMDGGLAAFVYGSGVPPLLPSVMLLLTAAAVDCCCC